MPRLEQAVNRGRRAAERLMTDTCTVTEVTGQATDPVTARVTPVTTTHYSGKAKRQSYQPNEATPEAGGHNYTVQRYWVHFPAGSFKPAVGHVITWTSCPLDPDLEGTTERIVSILHKSQATALRVFTDEGAA